MHLVKVSVVLAEDEDEPLNLCPMARNSPRSRTSQLSIFPWLGSNMNTVSTKGQRETAYTAGVSNVTYNLPQLSK